MDEQKELRDAFRQQQERYVYYLIALSVAGIGYSMYNTNNQAFSMTQLPLGIAVLLWGISAYFGLKFLKYTTSNLYTNSTYFDIVKGIHPLVGNHPDDIGKAKMELSKIMKSNAHSASKYFIRHERFFYAAISIFVVGHIYGMYIASTIDL